MTVTSKVVSNSWRRKIKGEKQPSHKLRECGEEQTDLCWDKNLFHEVTKHKNLSDRDSHTRYSTAFSLPMQCGPLSAVLPGTFGGVESDQAPTSIQSTQDSSVPANYSSHLIWEGEGGRTDECWWRGRERRREEEGGVFGDQWDLCSLTGTMNHM